MKNKPNIGDQYIIEIDRIYSSKKHDVSRYGIKGFSCLIFDERGLERLHKYESANAAYQRGLDEAWEMARKILSVYPERDMSAVFGGDGYNLIEEPWNYPAHEALLMLAEYEARKRTEGEIKVGDEVTAEDGTAKFIVTKVFPDTGCIAGIDREGNAYSYFMYEIDGKTGRRFDIRVLEKEGAENAGSG